MEKESFIHILNTELELAAGCTEPAAVALASAAAARALEEAGGAVEHVAVSASTNILKNAMAAGIPGTKFTGMDYAAAIGAVGGDPSSVLEVISGVSQRKLERAEELVRAGGVTVTRADTPQKLYIDVTVTGGGHTGRAVISELHTKLTLIQSDDRVLLRKAAEGENGEEGSGSGSPMTMAAIWDFCTKQYDPEQDQIRMLEQAVEVNSAISAAGLEQDYGLSVGRNLARACETGVMTMDLTVDAMMRTAAGADARMAGAPLSVVTNSGSGNQGITATMPVVAAARWLGVSRSTMMRALALSHLVSIHIKSGFGRLSNLCGATVAGTGAACGITYLLGGDFEAVCGAVHNMVGNVAGLVCDGAKADCALKISSSVNAAVQAALLAVNGVRVRGTDGVVEEDVEHTIQNFGALSKRGTADEVILDLMLHKHNNSPCGE